MQPPSLCPKCNNALSKGACLTCDYRTWWAQLRAPLVLVPATLTAIGLVIAAIHVVAAVAPERVAPYVRALLPDPVATPAPASLPTPHPGEPRVPPSDSISPHPVPSPSSGPSSAEGPARFHSVVLRAPWGCPGEVLSYSFGRTEHVFVPLNDGSSPARPLLLSLSAPPAPTSFEIWLRGRRSGTSHRVAIDSSRGGAQVVTVRCDLLPEPTLQVDLSSLE